MNYLITQFYIHPSKLRGKVAERLKSAHGKESFLRDCMNTVESYASTVGVPYLLVDEPEDPYRHPACERLRLLYEKRFREYDAILYLDADVKVMSDESIFQFAERDALVVADRWYSEPTNEEFNKSKAIKNARSFYRKFLKNREAERVLKYEFNSGVILFGADTLPAMERNLDWDRVRDKLAYQDQIELNYLAYLGAESGDFRYEKISKHWNELRPNQNTRFNHIKNSLGTSWDVGRLP